LPQEKTKGIHVGGQVVRFASSHFRRHVTKRASVSRELVKFGAPVPKRRIELLGKAEVKNLDVTYGV
jgi:hypothetical protein